MTKGEKNKDISDISIMGGETQRYWCTKIVKRQQMREFDIGGEI